MESIPEALELIDRHIARAVAAAAGDAGASPITRAVLGEFERKAGKARGLLGGGTAEREAIIELEQAGDSAKIAALADTGAAPRTRELVGIAHDAICMLKARL
jgi:hypothetical protein